MTDKDLSLGDEDPIPPIGVQNAPERIWLVVGELLETSDFHDLNDHQFGDGVLWSDSKIDDHDVEYVRADLVEALRQELVERDVEIASLRALSVRRILLAVVPGEDGMGEEVYAQSVTEVENLLADLGEKAEERDFLRQENERLKAEAAVRPAAETVPIPIYAAGRIAEEYGYDEVVVVARKVGVREHVTTYGVDKAHCAVAARGPSRRPLRSGSGGDAAGGREFHFH